jgi:hypothetical protein
VSGVGVGVGVRTGVGVGVGLGVSVGVGVGVDDNGSLSAVGRNFGASFSCVNQVILV